MNKKKFLIVASIILVVGIVGSLLTYRSAQTIIAEEKSINADQITAIDINASNAQLKILPTNDDKIKVVANGKVSSATETELTTDVRDSTLFININDRTNSWGNFFFSTFDLTVTVYLPEKQYDSLKIQGDNGSISMENVTINNIQAEIDNGRIELTNIISESVHTKTDNGQITLNHVEGELKGESSNGHLTLITQNIDRNINFETDNGSITIETEEEPTNVQFTVSVDNGKVNILDKYNGNTTIGNSENTINLSTNNGSIHVTKQ